VLRTIAVAGFASLAFAAAANAQPLPTPDFIRAAAQTDDFERTEGRLAEKAAASGQVRSFGAEMVTAHTKTTAALKAAIAKAGLPPPAPPTLTAEQTQNIATLRGLHGAAFDKAYVDQQIQAHQTALGVMQAYASGGDNPVIRKAAADTVPIVQHHLAMAQALH
jgi:putative membrane protein